MRTDLPTPIAETNHDLAPDALVKLFTIQLTDLSMFRISPKIEVTWQGDLYERHPAVMSELSQEADGKRSRPKFSFVNPEGIFNSAIYDGRMDNATVTRISILKTNLDADQDFAIRESFRVSKILNLTKDLVAVELRDVLDGHQFILPARAYYPPDFPHVKLQ